MQQQWAYRYSHHMLLKKTELEAIRSGGISLVFRLWRRPSVKTGGTLLTAIGQLAIDHVSKVEPGALKLSDLRKAGFHSLADLMGSLGQREGDLYRIEVRVAGADPRIALREKADLGRSELADTLSRLARLDKASPTGPWTTTLLRTIAEHPFMPAVQLAQRTGHAKEWLKLNVRKLKNLGLTISHHPGYELSSRGRALLKHLP